MIPYLNEQEIECPNYCGEDTLNYQQFCEHLTKTGPCKIYIVLMESKGFCDIGDGTVYSTTEINKIQERIDKIKELNRDYEPQKEEITLNDEWGDSNATCGI